MGERTTTQLAGDPGSVLMATNLWGIEQLLGAMAPLSDEQLDREFEMGLGTLRKTVTHVIASMRGWSDLLNGAEQRARLDDGAQAFSVAELQEKLVEVSAELDKGFAAGPMDGVCTGSRGGNSYSFTRGGVVTHVTTHGMYHRAQCLNMLRHVGVETLPPASVLEWMMMVEPVG